MGKIIAITVFELKKVFQKPQSYMLMFGMPIIFTLIFGSLAVGDGGNKPIIAVADEDDSVLSQQFVRALSVNDIIVFELVTVDEAVVLLDEQQINGYIRIEKGFAAGMQKEEKPAILFKQLPSYREGIVLEQFLNDTLQNLRVATAASSAYSQTTGGEGKAVQQKIADELVTNGANVEMIQVTSSDELAVMDNMTARSAGFTIMFVMITMLISTGVILESRQTGVWYRLMATPISRIELLFGYLLAFFLIGWVQFGVLMVISSYVFGVQWGNLLGNIMLVSALLLCTIGLGLFIAGFVKTTEQQSVFGNLIIVSTCMLGGVYWPLEIVPDFMQQAAKFVPQYWGLEGFAELAVRGGNVADVLESIGILLAFGLVFLVVGMTRIRFE